MATKIYFIIKSCTIWDKSTFLIKCGRKADRCFYNLSNGMKKS